MTDDWILHVYTWQGMSIGATHYYAEICEPSGKSRGEVMHKISEKEAATINIKNRRLYNDELVKLYWADPGDEISGFDTEEDAIAEAVKQWKEYAPTGSRLVDKYKKNHVYAEAR